MARAHQGRSRQPRGHEKPGVNSGADLGADPGPGAVRMRRVNRWLVEDIRENLGNLYEDSCATAPERRTAVPAARTS